MVQQEQDQVLGRDARGPITAERLDVVPWSHGNTNAVVEFTTNELTATCPITGQPDFYELKLSYRPQGSLIESKALKLYLWGFRDKGIFAEDLAARLLRDLVGGMRPTGDDGGPDAAGTGRAPDPYRRPPAPCGVVRAALRA